MSTAKFYTFDQNNSGGSFSHDPDAGIGYCVCIEAYTADQADAKAEVIGIYFNGVENGNDCPCCGSRWYSTSESDGKPEPSLYGSPLEGGWGIPSYIHYLDGRVVAVPDPKVKVDA